MKKHFLIAAMFLSSFTIAGSFSHASNTSSIARSLMLPKVYHFEINFGVCQVNVDIVDFGNHHYGYAWASNCGGHHSGGGQLKTIEDTNGNEKVDESSVTFEFDDNASQTYFNSNGGSQKLIDGLVASF